MKVISGFSAERLSALRLSTIESELLGEKASSLGHHGRMVETTMAALHGFDPGADRAERLPLVKAAARAVWAYFVQRELCGMRDHREIIRFYRIPQDVLNRLGAMD